MIQEKGWPGTYWLNYLTFLKATYGDLWLTKGTEVRIWKDYWIENLPPNTPMDKKSLKNRNKHIKTARYDMKSIESALLRAEGFLVMLD